MNTSPRMRPDDRHRPRRPRVHAPLLRVGAVLALAAALLTLVSGARAQCGAKRSTCSACHDGAHAAYGAADPWHADHAFADLCVDCHGGHGDERESAAAHVGLAAEVAATRCAPCHAATGGSAPERYAYARVSPSAPAPSPKVSSAPARTIPPHGSRRGNTIVGLLAAAIGAAGVTIVVRKERRR